STIELEDLLSAGDRSRQPKSAHRRFRSRVDQAQHLDRWHRGHDHLRQLHLTNGWSAEGKAARGRLLHGLDDEAVAMAEDHGAPGADTVDVLKVVGVEHARALRLLDEGRRAAHRAKGADRRVHAAWNDLLRAVEKLLGLLGHRGQCTAGYQPAGAPATCRRSIKTCR